jgi:hypothetical protein
VARNVEEHERQRMLRRRPTGNTLSMVTRTHRQPWRPTDAQAATARSLAESDGAFARTHADGTAEVRTIERGALHRYIIDPDGFLELVEVAPQSPRYTRSSYVFGVGLVVCFGSIIAGFAGEGINGLPSFPPEAVRVGAILGFVVTVFGLATMPRLAPPPGERWKHLGAPGGD